jgi:hypothetical protein
MSARTLTLIRGLPGSGKTRMARAILNGINAGRFPWDRASVVHLEADDFFLNERGNFVFDKNKLFAAHSGCLRKCRNAMEEGTQFIIVANTFVRLFELEPYHSLAKQFNYEIQEVTVEANFQNSHKVPPEAIERMRKFFQVRPRRHELGDALNNNVSLQPAESDTTNAPVPL